MLPQLTPLGRGNAIGPCFRGPGVAMWPHPIGGEYWFDDLPVSSAGFLVSASKVDETAFDCVASTA